MAIAKYKQGQLVRLSATFRNDAHAPDDPTTVTFRVVPPPGSLLGPTDHVYGTGPSVVRDGTGVYHLDLIPDAPGDWWWSYEGTGNIAAYDEALFTVPTRRIAESV